MCEQGVNRRDYFRFGMSGGKKNWATRSWGPAPNKAEPQILSLPAQMHFTKTRLHKQQTTNLLDALNTKAHDWHLDNT